MTEDDIRRAAADLAGGPVRDLIPARPGGNNRIFKVVTQDGAAHALKIYPQQAEDPRDRLGVEFRALSFLSRKGIGRVPRAVAMDRPRHCALYEWIEGAPPPRCDASIDALARFLADLKELAADPEARDLGPASAACPSAAVLSRQVEERRRKLDAACADSGLAALLTGEFDPLAARLLDRARKGFARGGLDFEAALPPARQVLSPSDFGFHNALAVPGGGLRFIDFEYFGWDDPVKAAADVALHAGMDLDPVQARRFLEGIAPAFTALDEHFITRLRLLYPLFALVWVLIILNEFLPERWARRVLATGGKDPAQARAGQLARAARRLAMLKENHDACPL